MGFSDALSRPSNNDKLALPSGGSRSSMQNTQRTGRWDNPRGTMMQMTKLANANSVNFIGEHGEIHEPVVEELLLTKHELMDEMAACKEAGITTKFLYQSRDGKIRRIYVWD